jgi:hypothetical protein
MLSQALLYELLYGRACHGNKWRKYKLHKQFSIFAAHFLFVAVIPQLRYSVDRSIELEH